MPSFSRQIGAVYGEWDENVSRFGGNRVTNNNKKSDVLYFLIILFRGKGI